MSRSCLIVVIVIILAPVTGLAAMFDHSDWDALLQRHVSSQDGGRNTVVNYLGMAEDRRELRAYLDLLAQVDRETFDDWSPEEQLAFLINAYNAWTVELVLTRYPDIESIKDLGTLLRSPWKKPIVVLFGKTLTLDTIEHDWIRGSARYNDPRIHFAINCASVGCPALRSEAYRSEALDVQLQEQTYLFLSDHTRNHLTGDSLYLSSIFKWYQQDFEQGWRNIHSLSGFFARYMNALKLTATDIQRLKIGDIDINFKDYDWRLNQLRPASEGQPNTGTGGDER